MQVRFLLASKRDRLPDLGHVRGSNGDDFYC